MSASLGLGEGYGSSILVEHQGNNQLVISASSSASTVSGGASTVISDNQTSGSRAADSADGSGAIVSGRTAFNAFDSSNADSTVGSSSDRTPVEVITSALAGNRFADTLTGKAIEALFATAVDTQIGAAGGSAFVADANVYNVDGTDTITVDSKDDTVLGVTSHTGANIMLNAPFAIVGGRFDNVTLGDEIDASISLIQFAGNLLGGAGSDSIQVGGASTATISGGAGNDTFIFQSSWFATGSDAPYLAFKATISDFSTSEDKLLFQFDGVHSYQDLLGILATAKDVSGSTVVTTTLGDSITLTGVSLSSLTEDLFLFS